MAVPLLPPSSSFNSNSGSSPATVPPAIAPASTEAGGMGSLVGLAKRQAIVIVGVAVAFFSYSAWKTVNQETEYLGSFQILVEPVNAENASLAVPAGEGGGRSRSAELDYPTQIAILKSPELLSEVSADLSSGYPGVNAGSLAGQISIERLGKTKLLQVKYQSGSATKTQAVLDALVEKYLQYSLSERQTYLRQGIQFVDEQIESLGAQLSNLQDQLESFQQQNNFTTPESRSEQLSSQLETLVAKEQELAQSLNNTQAQGNILQQDDGIQVLLESDSAYQELLNQIREIDAQIAIELTRFKPENPVIQSLQKRRDNLLPLLEQRAEQFIATRLADVNLQTQALESQLQAVRGDQAQIEGQLQTVPTLNRRYTNLQKEIEITNNSLTGFLESRQALQVEAAQREIPWELVREPVAAPLPSTTSKDLLTALLMGVALGVAIAFALDKLDNTYHTTDQLRADIKLPLLGTLPFNQQLFLNEGVGASGQSRKRKPLSRLRAYIIKSSAKVSKSMSGIALSLLDEYDTAAEFVESIRVINTNLQMNADAAPVRSVTISSASPEEGKSTLALNWAETAVSMGQRVLLIDGVLRNPQLHQILELPNQVGLSNLLTGEFKPPEGIQQVHKDGKLYAVTGGPTSDNPAGLLGTHRMKEILSYYENFFDLIIIDSPPLFGLADAKIISRKTDGLVLVVRLDRTDKSVIRKTIEDIQSTRMSVIGMVVNGHKGHNIALHEAAIGAATPMNSDDISLKEETETKIFSEKLN